MASAAEVRTRRTAALINALVEKLYPMAPLKVFSSVTRELFRNDTEFVASQAQMSNTASLGMDLLRLKGEEAVDLFSTISEDDQALAKRLLVMLLGIGGHLDKQNKPSIFQSTEDPAERERRIQGLRDFLTALQGVEGHFLRNTETRSLVLTRGEEKVLLEALDKGKQVARLRTIAGRHVADSSLGVVSQRFGHALHDELSGFDRFIAVFERQILQSASTDDGRDQRISLYQMRTWCESVFRRVDLLLSLCESCESLRGGSLCSALYAHTFLGDTSRIELANRILRKVFVPLEEMILDFCLTGRLARDPHQEFFVAPRRRYLAANAGENDSDDAGQVGGGGVYGEYTIVMAMVPTFIGKEFAWRVLRCGCESRIALKLDLVRRSITVENNADDLTADDPPEASLVGEQICSRLETTIQTIEAEANDSVITSLLSEHRLLDHLDILKKFLLLGQGDFAQYLVELSYHSLSRPVGEVSKMELLSNVEQACRTCIKVEDESLLENRIDCLVLDDDRSALGWDVFLLSYHLDFPLTLIVDDSSMIKYQRVFRFLWRLKRVQFSLEEAWKQQHRAMNSVRAETEPEQLRRVLHKCHLVRSEMVHFATNLLSYVMFEVIETSFDQLMCDIDQAETIANLIDAHHSFLDNVHLKALIVDEGNDLNETGEDGNSEKLFRGGIAPASKSPIFSLRSADFSKSEVRGLSFRLDRLFEIVLKFCALQDRFILRISEERQGRALMRRMRSNREREARWGGGSDDIDDLDDIAGDDAGVRAVAEEYGEHVDFVASEFWENFSGFLKALDLSNSDNLRFLGFRLDFNRFY